MDLAEKLAKVLKVANLPEEAVLFLVEKGCALVEEEKADRRAFAEELERMTDDELRRFVPDVYQKNIYKIDYRKLKEQGIRLISFDIDAIKAAGYLCTTPMIVCNTDDYQSVTPKAQGQIQAGAPLLEIKG